MGHAFIALCQRTERLLHTPEHFELWWIQKNFTNECSSHILCVKIRAFSNKIHISCFYSDLFQWGRVLKNKTKTKKTNIDTFRIYDLLESSVNLYWNWSGLAFSLYKSTELFPSKWRLLNGCLCGFFFLLLFYWLHKALRRLISLKYWRYYYELLKCFIEVSLLMFWTLFASSDGHLFYFIIFRGDFALNILSSCTGTCTQYLVSFCFRFFNILFVLNMHLCASRCLRPYKHRVWTWHVGIFSVHLLQGLFTISVTSSSLDVQTKCFLLPLLLIITTITSNYTICLLMMQFCGV